jgi:hypothetical protein
LVAKVDYTISTSLDFQRVVDRQPHRLSLMVNETEDGSHGFMFAAAGQQSIYCPAWFTPGEIDADVNAVRDALRLAAYGHADPWVKNWEYRYGNPTIEQLAEDLKRLALAGHRVHSTIKARLSCETADGVDAADRLVELMKTPGLVEIASRISPSLVLPAAALYGEPLDDGLSLSDLELCADFIKALKAEKVDLENHACFNGQCTSAGNDKVVCPGNFWGFRHWLGLPVSVRPYASGRDNQAHEAAVQIVYDSDPLFDVSFATALDFRDHLDWLERRLQVSLRQASTRADTFELFKSGQPHIFYFYCHAGLNPSNIPYLRVGGDAENPITPTNVSDKVRWPITRPLVFINGCHTTALEPNQALQFVSAFVENGHASGVIGTEITIFEPLATEFAQEFFSRLIVQSQSVGRAVHSARLALLARMNPLGLAYVPFAPADLVLRRRSVAGVTSGPAA